jgi:hypothetical protein
MIETMLCFKFEIIRVKDIYHLRVITSPKDL